MENASKHRQQLLVQLEEAGFNMAKAIKSQQGADDACVSPASDKVIVIIGKSGSTTVKQLASFLMTTSGAVTQHIATLEELGLVTRAINRQDRREVLVELTPKGQTTYIKIKQSHTEKITMFLECLDDRELDTLLQLMIKLSTKQGVKGN
jgi:DNA-binding MarR family transcriptional regulator